MVCTVVPAVNTTGLLLPSTTPAIVKVVTDIAPSPDTKLVSITLPVLTTSSGVEVVSSTSVNVSFTGVTVIISVEVSPTVAPASSDIL